MMKLLQFVFKLRIRLVEHTVCFAIKVREPIENDLLVAIILSNLPHNTRQTLYAHVTRGDAHTHTHAQEGSSKWRRCIHHIRCRHFFRNKEISLIYVQHSLPVCVCVCLWSVWAHVVHASCTLYYTP